MAAALYGRQVSGESSVIDVSLLVVGAWTTQFTVNLALLYGERLPKIDNKTAAPGKTEAVASTRGI